MIFPLRQGSHPHPPGGPGGASHFAAPLLVGLAIGLGRFLPEDPSFGFVYWQSPFLFTVLGGLAIAFACRPVLSRIPWRRSTAMGLGFFLLTVLGQPGDWVTGALMAALGLGGIPLNLPAAGWPLLTSAAAGGVAMGWFFRPAGKVGMMDWANLRARISSAGAWRLLLKAALAALVALVVVLLAGWGDARWEDGAVGVYLPLVEPNPWLKLEGISLREQAPWNVVLFPTLLWLRWLLAVLALLPIALTLRGSWLQLTLVFGVLLFVIGDFAPLMLDQPYPSLAWLLERVALGIIRAFAIGWVCAGLLGIRSPGGEALR